MKTTRNKKDVFKRKTWTTPFGSEVRYFKNGVPHRENGHAKVSVDNNGTKKEFWYFEHKLHNINGPAIIVTNELNNYLNKRYFIKNKEMSFEEWEIKSRKLKIKQLI